MSICQLLLHMVFTSRNWFAMQGPVAIILISWNVIFIWETGCWTRAIKRLALFDLLKVYIPITRSCRNIFRLCRDDDKRCIFTLWKRIKIRKSTISVIRLNSQSNKISVPKLYYYGPRKLNVILTQIRCTASFLNHDLHKGSYFI